MELKLDLHIHSAASNDGRMTLAEIVAAAKEKGLDGVAVCDHDRLFQPARKDAGAELLREDGMLVIPGEEFSTEYGHLLGLFLTAPVAAKGFAATVEAIRAQGGLAVLAHPFEHHGDAARIAPILPLLDGLEVWNGRADRKRKSANAEAAALAESTGLPRFAGSDAHLPREIGNGVVTVTVEEATADALKAALLRPGNPIEGRSGRHIDVAKSQHTVLKKTKAGCKKRIRWLLFAAKCAAEDVFKHR